MKEKRLKYYLAVLVLLTAVLGFSDDFYDFYKKITSADSNQEEKSGIQNNNNGSGIQNNNTGSGNQFNQNGDGDQSNHIGDTIHDDKTVNYFGVLFEQWKSDLDERDAQIRQQESEIKQLLANKNTADKEKQKLKKQLETLSVEHAEVQALLANPRASYEARIKELEDQIQHLQALKGVFPKETLEQALKALRSGDSKQATALFAEVEAQAEPSIEATAESRYQRGLIARSEIRYGEALAHFERAHQLAPHNMDYHLTYARMLHTLADYGEARRQYQKLLPAQEQTLGAEHRYVATTLNNMGNVYRAQGDYAKALEYYERALAIWGKALGEGHPNVASTLNNMGSVYYSQGEYAKALDYYERVLSIEKKTLGKDHPSYATTLNNMGFVYKAQGEYAKALEFFERALAILKKVLAPAIRTFNRWKAILQS